jgi:chromosome segregation ATPase
LSKEKDAQSAADRSLVEEKATQQAVEQALQSFDDGRAGLARELESTQASLTTTHDKLTTKAFALDTTVIREQQMKVQLMGAEEKLKAAEEKLETQGQSVDSAR